VPLLLIPIGALSHCARSALRIMRPSSELRASRERGGLALVPGIIAAACAASTTISTCACSQSCCHSPQLPVPRACQPGGDTFARVLRGLAASCGAAGLGGGGLSGLCVQPGGLLPEHATAKVARIVVATQPAVAPAVVGELAGMCIAGAAIMAFGWEAAEREVLQRAQHERDGTRGWRARRHYDDATAFLFCARRCS
jgi:hypothetical protein